MFQMISKQQSTSVKSFYMTKNQQPKKDKTEDEGILAENPTAKVSD